MLPGSAGNCRVKMDLNPILSSNLKPLDKISPSRFIELGECPLRVAFATSGIPRLIPNSPDARLGSIIHKMFDLASKGIINNDLVFVEKWNEILTKVELEMASNILESHFVPLNLHTRHFDVKKDLCFLGVRRIIKLKKSNSSAWKLAPVPKQSLSSTGSELYFETPDKKVNGMVDAIRYGKNGVEIIDYKSGVILEETGNGEAIKNSYQIQLKIYAALYYLNEGIWPSKLKLLGINQQDFDVPFTPAECLQLIEKAKQNLEEVNNLITSERSWENLANPSPKACRFCQYRPVCKKYLKLARDGNGWALDIAGKISEKREFKNGYRIVLQTVLGKLVVRALDPQRHNILNEPVENIMLFNLRSDTAPKHFTGGNFTLSYATPYSFA
jgi:CRISPR/Cas system-associated exonuclease Cas4 (RecB family)